MVVRSGRLLAGILLIVVGCLFLLRSLGVIQVELWGLVVPVFLIALGVWGIWSASQSGKVAVSERLWVPTEGASRAVVIVRYGAGRLRIAGGTAPGEVLAGDFGGGVERRMQRDGEVLMLELHRPPDAWVAMGIPWAWSRAPEWSLRLANDLPMSLRLETGACESDIDLSRTLVDELRLKTGASATRVTLPGHAGPVKAEVEAGAASVRVRVPEGTAVRIRSRAGLAEIRIDERRFPRAGEVHQSEGYEQAINRIDLDLQAGVGSIEVE